MREEGRRTEKKKVEKKEKAYLAANIHASHESFEL